MLIIDSKKSNEKTQIHEQIKIISKRLTVFYPEFLGYTSIYSYCVLDLSQHQWHFVIYSSLISIPSIMSVTLTHDPQFYGF